ncbi:MAG: hypothetical protein ACYC65_11470 [Candidatus Limnocylindrales bacterium]
MPPEVEADQLAHWRDFRASFGLRDDVLYVRSVAADPSASDGQALYGVPLLPSEVVDLQQRQAESNRVVPVVTDYGERYPDQWAGAWIDQLREGLIVAQFTGDLAGHETALRALTGADARLEVRLARWSLYELTAFADRVRSQPATWMRSIAAVRTSLGPDIERNRIELGVSSANPDAATLVVRGYGSPEWLHVSSDGTGQRLVGTGVAVVTVRSSNGAPVSGLRCVLVPDWGGEAIVPSTGGTTDASGVCRMSLPVTGYWIRIERGPLGAAQILALGRISVRTGATGQARIVVTDQTTP